MANTGFRGIDVRQTDNNLMFRAFLLDELGQEVTSGTASLYLYELQSDGTLKSYDFDDDLFKTTALTTETASMTHQTGNNGTTDTGIWTHWINPGASLTPGAVYLAKVTHSDIVAECREFQFGEGQGDMRVDLNGKLTLAPVQSFSTSGSVGSVAIKTGFSLASSQSFSTTGSVGSVTGAVGSVTGSVASVTGAVGSVTGNVGGNVTGSVGSVVGAVASVTGSVGSVTGSVGSVTGAVGSVTADVTVGDYATGKSPADLVLVTPSQPIATDVSGNVSTTVTGDVTVSAASITAIQDGLATSTALSTLQGDVDVLPSAADVASAILVTPANKLATDGTGGVTAATVSDKTGYSLSASQSFSTSGSVGSVTGNVGGSVASVTADVGITQAGADKVWGSATRDLTTFGTLVADTAAAVWAVLTSSLTSVGTIGKFFMDRINDTITSRLASGDYTTPPTESAISTQVAADLLAVHGSGSWETSTGFAVAGDAMTLTAGAITSVQSGLATDTNLATVDTVVDAIKLKTDNLPSDPASEANVSLRLLTTAYTTPPTAVAVSSQVMTDMTAAHGSGDYNQIADVSSLATQASLNAVKAKTDLIPADPATETTLATLATTTAITALQSSVDALPAASDVATAILVTPANKLATDSSGNVTASSVSDKTGYSLSTAGVTAVQSGLATSSALATVDTVVDGIATTLGTAGDGLTSLPVTGYKLASDGLDLVLVDGKTLPAALQIVAATTAGKASGAGTGTETFVGLDGVTTRVVGTVDNDGNRTAVTYS